MKFRVKIKTHNQEIILENDIQLSQSDIDILSNNIELFRLEGLNNAKIQSFIGTDLGIIGMFSEIEYNNHEEIERLENTGLLQKKEYYHKGIYETYAVVTYPEIIKTDIYYYVDSHKDEYERYKTEYRQLKNDYIKSSRKIFKNEIDKLNIQRYKNSFYLTDNAGYTIFISDLEKIEEDRVSMGFKPLRDAYKIWADKQFREQKEKIESEKQEKLSRAIQSDIDLYVKKIEELKDKGWEPMN